jgi:shikimate kinase
MIRHSQRVENRIKQEEIATGGGMIEANSSQALIKKAIFLRLPRIVLRGVARFGGAR